MAKKDLKAVTVDGKVKITINIPKKILLEMDHDREHTKHTRSSWITTAIMERLSTKKDK